MKSVIQEGSSVAKAIELALAQATHPKDFSIKVLEYPTKNFFGITTRPARIALYWDDKATQKSQEPHPIPTLERSYEREPRDQRPERSTERTGTERPSRQEQRREQHTRPERSERREQPQREQRHEFREQREPKERETREMNERIDTRKEQKEQRSQYQQQPREQTNDQEHEPRPEESRTPCWTPEIVEYSNRWLRRVLIGFHRDIPFTMEMNQFCLHITFPERLFEDADHERKVLASLSLLLLETCRHTFKVNLRGHKVLLTHATTGSSNSSHAG